jgi:hypothetical protein
VIEKVQEIRKQILKRFDTYTNSESLVFLSFLLFSATSSINRQFFLTSSSVLSHAGEQKSGLSGIVFCKVGGDFLWTHRKLLTATMTMMMSIHESGGGTSSCIFFAGERQS